MPPLAGTPAAVMHSSTQLLPCPVLPTAHQHAIYVASWHAAVGNNLYELLLCKELQLHGATTKRSGARLWGCATDGMADRGRAHTSSGETGRTWGGGIMLLVCVSRGCCGDRHRPRVLLGDTAAERGDPKSCCCCRADVAVSGSHAEGAKYRYAAGHHSTCPQRLLQLPMRQPLSNFQTKVTRGGPDGVSFPLKVNCMPVKKPTYYDNAALLHLGLMTPPHPPFVSGTCASPVNVCKQHILQTHSQGFTNVLHQRPKTGYVCRHPQAQQQGKTASITQRLC